MQVSRIEQKIEDIYAFVESCKMQHLSTTKVVVPKMNYTIYWMIYAGMYQKK